MFVGRHRELAELEEVLAEKKPQLVRLFGRRRLGKTLLLQELLKEHPGLYLEVSEGNRAVQLETLAGQIADQTGTPPVHLGSWDAMLDLLESTGARLVAIDEFQNLVSGRSGVVGRIQSRWDRRWRSTGPSLILCGSSIGMMQRLTHGEKGPLFGRLTANLQLHPMPYHEVREFYPDLDEEERIRRYGVFGGTPFYHTFSLEKTLEQAIRTAFFRSSAALLDEPPGILQGELREPSKFSSILYAMGHGSRALRDIESKLAVPRGSLSWYLQVLENDLDLVRSESPLGGAQKSLHYVFADPFFDFYYRFVYPNRGALEIGSWEELWARLEPQLDGHLGHVFEAVVRDAFVVARGTKVGKWTLDFEEIGRWWNRSGEEVDLVLRKRGRVQACEVSWSRKPEDVAFVSDLLRKVEMLRRLWPDTEVWPVSVTRSGLEPSARELLAGHHGVVLDLKDLVEMLRQGARNHGRQAEHRHE